MSCRSSSWASKTRSISSSIGIGLHSIEPLPKSLPDDAIVIVFGNVNQLPSDWGRRVDHETVDEDSATIVRWLQTTIRPTHTLIGICSGSLFFGLAGLLDGRSCTTHHADCAALSRLAPKARVIEDRLFVQDGNIFTSAGITAGIDLCLALLEEDLGHEAALNVARYLVMFLVRPGGQAQYSHMLSRQAITSKPLRELQVWTLENLREDLTVEKLADRIGMSPRHFTRVFTAEIGEAPGQYVERIRTEAARRQLEETDDTVVAIAARCGFGTAETMRRNFLRRVGISPDHYRKAFA